MIQFAAFMKKEVLEQLRTGKILILTILFCLFGIMNPAMAKLTPWFLKISTETLAESGMLIQNVEVNALTSWAQFFKNMPIALVIFIVMSSSIFTAEYQTGTLINIITKGMKRWKILTAKTAIMAILWTLEYAVSFGITYLYTAYFWDNSIAHNICFAAFTFYMIGLWLISIIPLASAFFSQSSAVILSGGAAFLAAYLLSLLPDLKKYMPTYLSASSALLSGTGSTGDYTAAMIITLLLMAINTAAAIVFFNKKNL